MFSKFLAMFVALIFSFAAKALDESCVQKTGCDLKKCELGVQIIYAEKMKNKREVAGLNKALDAVHKECAETQAKLDKRKSEVK